MNIKEFEKIILMARAKAFSNVSLTRPLTEQEFNEYKSTMEKLTR